MRATVDLIAMYNYDNTLLDLMQIPEDIDRTTLIDNLKKAKEMIAEKTK